MKRMSIKRIFIGAAFFIILPGWMTAQISPYEPEIVKAFADSLYEEGFLVQAEGEYKRFLFSFKENKLESQAASPMFQSSLISLCNIYKTRQDKDGINWLNKNFYSYAKTVTKEKINVLRADFIFKERDAAAFDLFQSDIMEEQKSFSSDFSNLIKASGFLLNNDIPLLQFNVPFFAEQSSDFEKLNELCSSYKTKSPGLALFLSSIIPGCGKWYTGSFPAFFSSFLSIGTFVAGTVVTGIQTEWKSWQPYVFGTCGLVLYIAELYGAYKSAQRYNNALFRALCEETESIYEKIY